MLMDHCIFKILFFEPKSILKKKKSLRHRDNPTYLDLIEHQIQMACVWLASRSNIFRFSCVLSSSTYKSSKLLDIILFDSATRKAQLHMGMTSCHTQHPWIQPRVNPKWIWWAATLNIIGFSYMLSSSTYEHDEFPDPNILGSAMH